MLFFICSFLFLVLSFVPHEVPYCTSCDIIIVLQRHRPATATGTSSDQLDCKSLTRLTEQSGVEAAGSQAWTQSFLLTEKTFLSVGLSWNRDSLSDFLIQAGNKLKVHCFRPLELNAGEELSDFLYIAVTGRNEAIKHMFIC